MIETTPSPMDRLFRLQEVLLELKSKAERRARTPDHLVHIEAAFQDSLRRREEVGAQLGQAEGRKRALEDEIGDLNEQIRKYQAQLVLVKTNREYSALLNEIDGVKREIRSREDELLSIEEALGAARQESLEFEKSFPQELGNYETEMTGWRAEQKVLDEEIRTAEERAEELRKAIDKKLLATFDRIAKSRAGIGIARVLLVTTPGTSTNQTAACAVCHVRLRPQLLADLRLSRDTIYCESCKRLLYWDSTANG